jgi:hypothetical protein
MISSVVVRTRTKVEVGVSKIIATKRKETRMEAVVNIEMMAMLVKTGRITATNKVKIKIHEEMDRKRVTEMGLGMIAEHVTTETGITEITGIIVTIDHGQEGQIVVVITNGKITVGGMMIVMIKTLERT